MTTLAPGERVRRYKLRHARPGEITVLPNRDPGDLLWAGWCTLAVLAYPDNHDKRDHALDLFRAYQQWCIQGKARGTRDDQFTWPKSKIFAGLRTVERRILQRRLPAGHMARIRVLGLIDSGEPGIPDLVMLKRMARRWQPYHAMRDIQKVVWNESRSVAHIAAAILNHQTALDHPLGLMAGLIRGSAWVAPTLRNAERFLHWVPLACPEIEPADLIHLRLED